MKEVSLDEQKTFVNQVNELDKAYRRGIKDYIKRAKVFLENIKKMNSFHDYKNEIPYAISLIQVGNDEFYEQENLGI